MGKFFAMLGVFSLEIYLAHPLFSTAPRAVLSGFHVRAQFPCVIFGVLSGVFVSFTLAILCRKLKFPYLFRWPQIRHNAGI
jgi:hypothetical protein